MVKIIKTVQKQLKQREKETIQEKKIDVDSLNEDQKEFIKNNKIILKTQERFKSERHNFF